MIQRESTITPTELRNEWVDRLLQPGPRGRNRLCTMVLGVPNYCPLGHLMQLCEDRKLILAGAWTDDRKGWYDHKRDYNETRILTSEVAQLAGIGTNPGFIVKDKAFKDRNQLYGWRDDWKFSIAFLNDHTDITREELVTYIATLP